MQGAIVKRGKKYSVVLFMGRDAVSGKPIQKWHSGGWNRKEAERARVELLHSMERGTYVAPSKISVGEFLIRWLDGYAKPNVAPKTYVRYAQIVEGRLLRDLGAIPLRALRPSHIIAAEGQWARELKKDGKPLSGRTILHHHRVLSEALSHAVKWQELAANPVAAVSPPRAERHAITPLDVQQSKALLAATAGDLEFGPVVALALWTGARLGEVTGLQWRDVDFEHASISIRRSIQKVRGYGLIAREPKTRRSNRSVTLSEQAVVGLRRTRARQNEVRLKMGAAYDEQGFVFASPQGMPLDAQAVRRHFRKLLQVAGLPRVRFHDLRHTHATLLLAQDEHPKIVSERLGHATIAITLDTYSHVLPNLQERTARKLDALLAAND